MPIKFEFNKGKMVPYPSGAIVPDRDLGERPALECIHLGIEFGGLKAVDDFSLTIGKTEIAGLIGPNGAGKTTVFNLLTKVYQPTHGTILLDGEDTSGKSVYQVNRMGIARTFQNIRLFNTMTVEDNVKVGLHNQERYSGFEGVLRLPTYWKHEKAAHERAMELLSIFDMEHLANEQAGSVALRRSASFGDRPRACHQPQATAARRACRRHEPVRDRGAHGEHRQDSRHLWHCHHAYRA